MKIARLAAVSGQVERLPNGILTPEQGEVPPAEKSTVEINIENNTRAAKRNTPRGPELGLANWN